MDCMRQERILSDTGDFVWRWLSLERELLIDVSELGPVFAMQSSAIQRAAIPIVDKRHHAT